MSVHEIALRGRRGSSRLRQGGVKNAALCETENYSAGERPRFRS